jgi:hypothetical protein
MKLLSPKMAASKHTTPFDDNKFTVYTKPCANKQFYNDGSTSNQTAEQNQRLLVKKTQG